MKLLLKIDPADNNDDVEAVDGWCGVNIEGRWYPAEEWYDSFHLVIDNWLDAGLALAAGAPSADLIFFGCSGRARISQASEQGCTVEWLDEFGPTFKLTPLASEHVESVHFWNALLGACDGLGPEIWEQLRLSSKWLELQKRTRGIVSGSD